ncbi:MAG: DUF4440 domain-containing protein [Treponema sp.]|nr:DUF4440 domain-containing protein [Treponema sp.]
MKKMIFNFLFVVLFILNVQGKEMNMNVTVSIGSKIYSVVAEDNDAAKAFFGRAPLSLTMSEWAGNNEYYARLSEKINAYGIKSPSDFATGDIAIYNNTSLVIFYADTKNTLGYAKIGHIAEVVELKDAIKVANGKVTFSVSDFTSAEKEVYAAYEAINTAMINKDRTTMERYFDENLTFTHMSGKKQTREEFIGEIMDGTLNYFKVDTKDYSIIVDGDTARMKVTHTLTAKVYGMSGAWTMSGENTYRKRGGIWVRVD